MLKAKRLKIKKALIFALMILSGCRPTLHETPHSISAQDFMLMRDMPIALDATRQRWLDKQDNEKVVCYSSLLSNNDLASFYEDELTLYGWHLLVRTATEHSLCLVFERPRRCCVVTRYEAGPVCISLKEKKKEA